MDNRWGSGLLGRTRRLSMDYHPVFQVSSVSCPKYHLFPQLEMIASRMPHIALRGECWYEEGAALTGPMIVACQWNCKRQRQYSSSITNITEYNQKILVKVDIRNVLTDYVMMDQRTRSSPIGPAEHDEGGSLLKCHSQCQFLKPKISCDRR